MTWFRFPDAIDLPGFRQYSIIRRFFRESHLAVYNYDIPDQINAAAMHAYRESLKRPIQIRIGRRFYKRPVYGGLPGILNIHQDGLISGKSFATHVIKSKLRKLKQTNVELLNPTLRDQLFRAFNLTFLPDEPIKCTFIISHKAYYIGSWELYGTSLISAIIKTCKNRTSDSLPPHVVIGVTKHFINDLTNENIVHMCPADFNENPYVLTCSNVKGLSKIYHSYYRLLPIHEEVFTQEMPVYEYKNNDAIQCGAWNNQQKIIVIGTDRGLYVNKLEDIVCRVFGKYCNAVEISDSGTTIFTISPRGNLIVCDLRIPNTIDVAYIGLGVKYMKILGNGCTLITSGYDDKLSNVDIRMNRVMFTYADFNNKNGKIAFTFAENWNVLCSPGQDNVTRYWDLHSGEVLASLYPPFRSDYQVHSVLTVNENILSTTIFFGDKMFCYEPL